MANTYLQRSVSSSGNRQKFTISFWVKRSIIQASGSQYIISQGTDPNNNFAVNFPSNGRLDVWDYGSAYNARLQTNRLFRDTNGWYHIVIRFDTTLSTAGDRVRLYVNGEQETSFNTSTNPSQNYNTHVNQSGNPFRIGYYTSGSEYFDGIVSHFHLCDGYSYAPTEFGSTDSTTGEWKIKTSPSVSYGTNGFFVLKDGNSVTDQSGQSNNLTVAQGTLTKTEDCPSNVFATLNDLYKNTTNDFILANGATDGACRDNTKSGTYTTLGMPSGKFYCEVKIRELQGTAAVGVTGRPQGDVHQNKNVGDTSQSAAYRSNGDSEIDGSTASYGNSYTTNDIIGIAIDVDNSKLYFSKNGTWQNSGDPTSGSTGTGALTMPVAASACEEGAYFFGYGDISTGGSTAPKFSFNFGNGYFATSAVASAGTNASNIGIFEYDVPAGYTALSTKGLNL